MRQRETRRKSQRSKKPYQNGRRSGGEAVRSPKGSRNRIRLDVEAVGEQSKVQKEQASLTDWMLKQQNVTQKSTRPRKITALHTRLSPPPEVHSTIISSPSYPISISFTCGEYVKRYEEATGADRLHILNRTIEDIRKKMYMK